MIRNKEFEIHVDLALLLSTSGSTGSSKLVKLSYENLVHNAKSIVEYLKIDANDIYNNITHILFNSKYQTITYFGLNPEKIRECVISKGLSGVDRIVPVGEALNIDTTWDGYNLLETLSRIVVIK